MHEKPLRGVKQVLWDRFRDPIKVLEKKCDTIGLNYWLRFCIYLFKKPILYGAE